MTDTESASVSMVIMNKLMEMAWRNIKEEAVRSWLRGDEELVEYTSQPTLFPHGRMKTLGGRKRKLRRKASQTGHVDTGVANMTRAENGD